MEVRSHAIGGTILSTTIIDWDGTNVPEELRQLPPGRYSIDVATDLDGLDELTEEEDAGIRHALDQIKAGEGIPAEEAMRRIRSRSRQR
jgi:hypothetical protein